MRLFRAAWVEQLFPVNAPSRVSGGIVTFAPRSSAWHTHPLGQVLIITTGTGRVQLEGGPIQVVHAVDVVTIPAHAKHWLGAAPILRGEPSFERHAGAARRLSVDP